MCVCMTCHNLIKTRISVSGLTFADSAMRMRTLTTFLSYGRVWNALNDDRDDLYYSAQIRQK